MPREARGYEYPMTADGCRPLRREERDLQGEVRFHVEEAVTSVCHAVQTSERREDFQALLAALLALKNAEASVKG